MLNPENLVAVEILARAIIMSLVWSDAKDQAGELRAPIARTIAQHLGVNAYGGGAADVQADDVPRDLVP